jgi:hypothetical protein
MIPEPEPTVATDPELSHAFRMAVDPGTGRRWSTLRR